MADILISGASVAGPALAYWLSRRGFRPTVVERAPHLRGGGYAVDFRGAIHLRVLDKMGILHQVRARQTHLESMAYVDSAGRTIAPMPAEIFAGDVEILRGDLARVLHDATRDYTEYLFGDTITALTEHPDGVDVTFSRAAPRTFDLVIGADGLHSAVRRLTFGARPDDVRDLGMYVSIFDITTDAIPPRTAHLFSVPGKTAGIFRTDGGAIAQLFFTGPPVREIEDQQRFVAEAFAGLGWQIPELMKQMRRAGDFYFDSVSQVYLDSWSRGRVALVGDAAAAAGPGGNGTGNAVVAAYVLAGELAAARGDHRTAFERYERLVRPYVARGQKQALGSSGFLAPATQKKIAQRNRAFRIMARLPVGGVIRYMSARTATAIKLPDYGSYPG
jgi:2-polyprenyl-6-methoxyphenol hydroxylase-like FAD-dependent oxidoreductase